MLNERLLPYVRGEALDCAVPSAFWCTYVLGELGRRGYGAQVVDFIRRRWSPMLSTGTTWEDFEWSEEGGNSASHAWSAHPSFHLVNVLVGIRQEGPGWREVSFSPCIVDGIDSARALVPAPPGDIEASWRRSGDGIAARLKLPDGVAARIELPGIRETHTGPCEVDFMSEAP